LAIIEEQKIKEYLLSIAGRINKMDDIVKAHREREHVLIKDDVGFWGTKRSKKKKMLDIGEASNKVIHTQSYRFAYAKTNNNLHYLKPKVQLFGTKNKEAWMATIDIIKFVEHAVNISYICNEI
jgi:hypothetical protein